MLKIKDNIDLETLKEYGFKHMIDKRVNYEWWQILFYLGTTIFGTILGFLINK